MPAQPIHNVVASEFEAVNALILDQIHSDVDMVETISRYLVESGGKRVRPLLTLLTAKCCNYQGDNHIPLATIIEFLHTATLLHDDVVDMSQLRRGRATANAAWGNAPSVLVGDFLYSRAFQMMIGLDSMRILSVLADSTNIIAEGEVLQLTNCNNPNLTEDEYRAVIHAKTAVLFRAASHTPAILSGVDQEQEDALADFGTHLGMAFQLVDDLLDYNGNSEEMGKNVGDDLAEGKMTLPLIYAAQHTSAENAELIRNAVKNGGGDQLEQIIKIVHESGALDYTKQAAQDEAKKALQLTEILPDNQYRQALRDLAELSVHRTK